MEIIELKFLECFVNLVLRKLIKNEFFMSVSLTSGAMHPYNDQEFLDLEKKIKQHDTTVREHIKTYSKRQNELLKVPVSKQCITSSTLVSIQAIALFFFSYLAILNGMSGMTIGGIAIGLGLGMILTNLCRGDVRKNKVDHAIMALGCLSFIVLGSLGVGRVMTASRMGLCLIGSELVFAAAAMGFHCVDSLWTKEGKERQAKMLENEQNYRLILNELIKSAEKLKQKTEEVAQKAELINSELKEINKSLKEDLEIVQDLKKKQEVLAYNLLQRIG